MIVKLKKSKLLATVRKSWTPLIFPPSGLEQFMLYSSTMFPSPKPLPCWDWPWIGNNHYQVDKLRADPLWAHWMPLICRSSAWSWTLPCAWVGRLRNRTLLAEGLHVADKAFENFQRPCVLWVKNDTMICNLISFKWYSKILFKPQCIKSAKPLPAAFLCQRKSGWGPCWCSAILCQRRRVCCQLICQLLCKDGSVQTKAKRGPLWPTLIFSCSSILVFYLRSWAWNPLRRGSKIKTLLNIVQTKRKQKLQVVVQFSQGRLSKELIMFSSIESCLTHRCSKIFLPFKAPQKQYIRVKVQRRLRKRVLLCRDKSREMDRQSLEADTAPTEPKGLPQHAAFQWLLTSKPTWQASLIETTAFLKISKTLVTGG